MGQIGQQKLHPVGDPLSFHRVHPVKISGCDQRDLKCSVKIKIRLDPCCTDLPAAGIRSHE